MSNLSDELKRKQFDAYLDQFYTKVYNYLMRLLKDPVLSEDCTQDAFLKAWNQYDKFDAEKPFLPWLLTLARNLVIDRIRQNKKQPQEQSNQTIPATSESALNQMAEQETIDQLETLLYQLPENQRTAIYLYYFQDFSIEEVAVVLKKSNRATISLIHRSRAALKKLFPKE